MRINTDNEKMEKHIIFFRKILDTNKDDFEREICLSHESQNICIIVKTNLGVCGSTIQLNVVFFWKLTLIVNQRWQSTMTQLCSFLLGSADVEKHTTHVFTCWRKITLWFMCSLALVCQHDFDFLEQWIYRRKITKYNDRDRTLLVFDYHVREHKIKRSPDIPRSTIRRKPHHANRIRSKTLNIFSPTHFARRLVEIPHIHNCRLFSGRQRRRSTLLDHPFMTKRSVWQCHHVMIITNQRFPPSTFLANRQQHVPEKLGAM